MKNVLLPAAALAMAIILPGCGSDEREQLIKSALVQIDSAKENMALIRDYVVKWENEKKEEEKTKLLKNAVELAGGVKDRLGALSKNALVFQNIKTQADKLEAGTPEDRKALVDKYRDRFASAIESANKERILLNEAIARAEKKEKGPLAELKISLQKAQGDFENLVKQR